MKLIGPAGGMVGANVAFIENSGSVLSTPMQLGPTRRIPCLRVMAASAASRTTPSPPTSLNPAEMTTRALTPFSPQASATSSTPFLRHDDHREIHLSGNRIDRGIGGHRVDRRGRGVDRVEDAGVPVAEQVVDDLIADGMGAATCADDGDGSGAEDCVEGRRHDEAAPERRIRVLIRTRQRDAGKVSRSPRRSKRGRAPLLERPPRWLAVTR